MSIFFTLVHLAALGFFIIFLVETIKKKKVGADNSHAKKMMLIALAVWFVSFILIGVTAFKQDQINNTEKTLVEDEAEVDDDSENELESLRSILKTNYDVSEPRTFVRGDNTGNWRIVKVANETPPYKYAVDYARAYMQDADSSNIHYIVNFSLKTTTKLQLNLGKLYVITTEYCDKEEHDASVIGKGMVLGENYYDMETGEEITTEENADAGTVDADTLIATVKEVIQDQVGEGEEIKEVDFDGTNLTITVDVSNADIKIDGLTPKDIAESRISSITDAILDLDDKYYNTWETITLDFGNEGKAVLNKSMVKDQGFGKFFDFPMGILD